MGGTVTRLVGGEHGPRMLPLGADPDSAWWAAFGFVTGRGLRTTDLNYLSQTNELSFLKNMYVKLHYCPQMLNLPQMMQ